MPLKAELFVKPGVLSTDCVGSKLWLQVQFYFETVKDESKKSNPTS